MSNYLGVDPGRSKTGLALVAADGKILSLHIAMTDNLAVELRKLQGIIMGNGTNNKAIGAVLRELYPDLVPELVGEAYSTEEARSLYWQENPPKGWRKLVPLGLLVPPEPLDAYAAVVQVRRWLKKNEEMD